jgi:hypothetical protein
VSVTSKCNESDVFLIIKKLIKLAKQINPIAKKIRKSINLKIEER